MKKDSRGSYHQQKREFWTESHKRWKLLRDVASTERVRAMAQERMNELEREYPALKEKK